MRIMVAEYSVGSREIDERSVSLQSEGRAMLNTLKRSFERLGNEVVSPVRARDFEAAVDKLSKDSDAGIVIAPDEMLLPLTEIVESNTVNLGCPSDCVRTCADKLRTTEILAEAGIPVPAIVTDAWIPGRRYVTKPRYGCASEDIFVREIDGDGNSALGYEPGHGDGFITTEYIEGEDISSSVVAGSSRILPLTVNKQFIQMEHTGRLRYMGGVVPYHVDAETEREIRDMSKRIVAALGCTGYVGIDFVRSEGARRAYVVDVNPRPTTSIVGIARVLNYELGGLLLSAKFGSLPGEEDIKTEGCFIFHL